MRSIVLVKLIYGMKTRDGEIIGYKIKPGILGAIG